MVDNGQNKINRTLEKQQEKVNGLIDEVLLEVALEIEARKKGNIDHNVIPSIFQLESITNELIKMKNTLSPKNYHPNYTRQIVDSWDIRSKLGEKLLAVSQEYKKLN